MSGHTGHTYLFYGIRGTDRTSITKIFARAMNYEHLVDGSPCNECLTCRSIQSGSSMNVVGIDTTSSNGVGNIRDIREQVQYPPTEGRYRVYIIDRVHIFSIGAFNTLLKTLEEPSSYVIFILAIAEVHRIPITTPFRCQHYDFRRVLLETIAGRLRKLTQIEQIQMEGKAPLYVAKAVNSSPRDALSPLDRCVTSHYGRVLTYDNALEVLGVMSSSVFSQMSGAIMEGRTRDCMCSLEEIVIQGRELDQSVTDFIWYMKSLLLVRSVGNVEDLMGMSEENLKQLRNDMGKADGTTLIRYTRIFSELSNQLHCASQKWVLVGVALTKLTHPPMESNLGAILRRLGDLEAQMENLETGRMAIPVTTAYQAVGNPPVGRVPQARVGPGQDGGAASQTMAPYTPGLQAEPGVMPERVALPRIQLEDLKLVRGGQVRIARSMGGGARSYLRNTTMEPDGGSCLIIVFMDPMNCDVGKWPTVTGELECCMETNFNRPICFRTGLTGRDECPNMIYVTREGLEEEVHVDVTHENE